jgi:hypothetical protein
MLAEGDGFEPTYLMLLVVISMCYHVCHCCWPISEQETTHCDGFTALPIKNILGNRDLKDCETSVIFANEEGTYSQTKLPFVPFSQYASRSDWI